MNNFSAEVETKTNRIKMKKSIKFTTKVKKVN